MSTSMSTSIVLINANKANDVLLEIGTANILCEDVSRHIHIAGPLDVDQSSLIRGSSSERFR